MIPIVYIKHINDLFGEKVKNNIRNLKPEDLAKLNILHKLLRRYDLDVFRLDGRGTTFKCKNLVENFYNKLNNLIDLFNRNSSRTNLFGGYYYSPMHGFSALRNEVNQKDDSCYDIDIEINDNQELFIQLRTICKNGFKTVATYKFSDVHKVDKKVILLSIILVTIVNQINLYLGLYTRDKENLYPVIKRYLYSIIKIDKDLATNCVYRNHGLILRQFYCLRGFEYYKHRLLKTEPKSVRFHLKE